MQQRGWRACVWEGMRVFELALLVLGYPTDDNKIMTISEVATLMRDSNFLHFDLTGYLCFFFRGGGGSV